MAEEKGVHTPEVATWPSNISDDSLPSNAAGDDALDFLKEHGTEGNFSQDATRMKALRRKIDMRVIPFLGLAYLMNYLDKIALNYAKVMGLTKELGLKGNDYTNASSAFWIAVLVFEFPSIYLLQRFPVGKYLAFTLFGWAVATACTASATTFSGLVVARVFSGAFEAAVPPALMLISSQWYTKNEQIMRFVWWYQGTAGGMVLGGFVSWCFQHVDDAAPLAGWRIMYIVLGLLTLVLAVLVWFLVPDTPMQARFLTDNEKVSLLEHVKINQTGVENRHFVPSQLKEAFSDFQLWCQWLIMLLEGGGGGVITTYSATLIVGFGYGTKEAALLNMGGGAVAIAMCFLTATFTRFCGNRWLALIFICIPTIIGAALMSYLPKTEKTGLLAGIYLVTSIFAAVPVQFAWVTANVAGHTKKACATTMLNAAFAIGNIIGPQTFQAADAPDYEQAKETMLAFQCVIILLAVTLYAYFRMVNKKRDEKSLPAAGEDIADSQAFAGLTDKQNPRFRYVY